MTLGPKGEGPGPAVGSVCLGGQLWAAQRRAGRGLVTFTHEPCGSSPGHGRCGLLPSKEKEMGPREGLVLASPKMQRETTRGTSAGAGAGRPPSASGLGTRREPVGTEAEPENMCPPGFLLVPEKPGIPQRNPD